MGCTAIQKEQLDANRCWQMPGQHFHSFTPKDRKSTQMPAVARFPPSHLARIPLFCLWLVSSLPPSSAHLSSSSPTHSQHWLPPTHHRWFLRSLLLQDGYLSSQWADLPGWHQRSTHIKEGSRSLGDLGTSYDSVVFLLPEITRRAPRSKANTSQMKSTATENTKRCEF